MDTVLDLLDANYSHIEGWVRIVYSYRVVKYCDAIGITYPTASPALADVMAVIDEWWMARLGGNV